MTDHTDHRAERAANQAAKGHPGSVGALLDGHPEVVTVGVELFESTLRDQGVGVVSTSMPMFAIENAAVGNTAYGTLNEGLGKVLRYGAYGPEVTDRLRWMQDVLGPAMQAAVGQLGSMDVRAIIVQAMQMGDELHNRNRAASALDPAHDLPGSSIVVAIEAAPAIVWFVGGQAVDALHATRSMYAIALAEHPHFQIPILEFRGTPVGIDVTRIARTGIVPAVNPGIAGKVPGTGQVGPAW